MRGSIALAAIIFTATSAVAGTYTFTDMKQEFWRPSPGVSLRFRRQTVTLSSPCFLASFTFDTRGNQISSSKPLEDSPAKDSTCAASQANYHAAKNMLPT
jgi:hypothetical protein